MHEAAGGAYPFNKKGVRMNEQFDDNHQGSPQVEPEIVAIIKRMQQQLVFLEKKIDTLISQSAERPFKDRNFSRPFRSFGQSHHHGGRKHGHSTMGGEFPQSRPFNKERGNESGGGFARKRKPFPHRGKNHV